MIFWVQDSCLVLDSQEVEWEKGVREEGVREQVQTPVSGLFDTPRHTQKCAPSIP